MAALRQVTHFSFLSFSEVEDVFTVPPRPQHLGSEHLALALGATFYSPGTRPDLHADAKRAAKVGLTSHVWCLEDAIPASRVAEAEGNVAKNLQRAWEDSDGLPFIFVRVREESQIARVVELAGEGAKALAGFVIPKVSASSASGYFYAVRAASEVSGSPLYALPVLETPELMWVESRREELVALRRVFDDNRDLVLCVRVGGTDFCGLFGIRRDQDTIIWDIGTVKDVLSDIVNVFARRNDYVVSGPVWEHFGGHLQLVRDQLLRTSPFNEADASELRAALLKDATDELLREVLADRTNGMVGKTVIHPSHISIVNSLMCVTLTEYDDALAIREGASEGGVAKSSDSGKMNEFGPHALWAEQILRRAEVFGVLRRPGKLLTLIERGREAAQENYLPGGVRD